MSDKAIKQFDFYEFAAVLCPGALLLFALTRLIPELGFLTNKDTFSFGDLGVFVLLAYVAGQFVQAVGTAIAYIWWKSWGGLPSDWARSGKHKLLAQQQTALLPARLAKLTEINARSGISGFSADDWYLITRQIYAVVRHAGRSERIDIFNGYYGMFRGLAACLLLVIIAIAVQRGFGNPRLYVLLVGALVLAIFRMHRFAVNYARELFVQFLATQKTDKPAAAPKEAE
jgi:hypothetical protein